MVLALLAGASGVPFRSLPARSATSVTGQTFVVESGGVYAICSLGFATDLATISAPEVGRETRICFKKSERGEMLAQI